MIYNGVIEGKYCDLKSIMVGDAEFTLAVRTDPKLTKFLPKLNITVSQQIEWIKSQQKDPTDYFFVVWDKKGKRVGTLGIYNIKNGIGETGRLAMKGNPLQAIEAQVLCVDFAFDVLKLDELRSYIVEGNDAALKYAKLFEPEISNPRINENGESVRDTRNTKQLYKKQRPKIERMIYRDR